MSGERHDMIEDDAENALFTTQSQRLMMSSIRPSSHSHVGVWSRGHTRGETNACCSIVCRCNTPLVAEDLLGHRKVTGARNCFNNVEYLIKDNEIVKDMEEQLEKLTRRDKPIKRNKQ
nr:hypothetical protein [Tanacetum cinerariifolium]